MLASVSFPLPRNDLKADCSPSDSDSNMSGPDSETRNKRGDQELLSLPSGLNPIPPGPNEKGEGSTDSPRRTGKTGGLLPLPGDGFRANPGKSWNFLDQLALQIGRINLRRL
jgi:hypothetical protein